MKRFPYILFFLSILLLGFISLRLSLVSALPSIRHNTEISIVIGIANLLLLWFLGKKLFDRTIAYYLSLLYSISPWIAYLEISGSAYIFLLFYILVLSIVYLSFQNKQLKLFSLCLGIIIILLFNYNKITIFSEIGLINAVNQFRGETSQSQFAFVGKFVENRYIYLAEDVLFNILKQFTPSIYFTPQARLLNYSFSPPILFGFLIPFLFGLPIFLKSILENKLLITLTFLLTIPSILTKQSPDLERLVIFSPILFLIISLGLKDLILRKKGAFKYLYLFCIFLLVLQFSVVISDILLREPNRFAM